jgi:hypothetical protein
MIRWAPPRRASDGFDRGWDYDAGCARDMIDASPPSPFPDSSVEYALGHGKACMRVVVGGTRVTFDHGRVPAPAAVRTA